MKGLIPKKGSKAGGSEIVKKLIVPAVVDRPVEAVAQKREFTEKEIAARNRDCVVKYGRAESYPSLRNVPVGSLIMEKQQKGLDEERKGLWVAQDEIEALPAWTPTIQPAVDRLLGASTAPVAKFMATVSRQERTSIVKRLVTNFAKIDKIAGAKTVDLELVEIRIWDSLFRLQKDQGVVLRAEIKKLTTGTSTP